MTQDGTSKDDVKLPEGDIGKQIQDEFDAGKDLLVTIVSAMGEEQVSVLFSCAPCITCMMFMRFLPPSPQAISFKEAPKGA